MGRVPGHEGDDLPPAYYELPFEALVANGIIEVKTGPLRPPAEMEVLAQGESREHHLHIGGSEEE